MTTNRQSAASNNGTPTSAHCRHDIAEDRSQAGAGSRPTPPPGKRWTGGSAVGSPKAMTLGREPLRQHAAGPAGRARRDPRVHPDRAAMASEPTLALQVGTNYATGMMRAFLAAGARAVGGKVDGPVAEGKDKRFADPTWTDNAAFWLLRQQYLLWEQALQELVAQAPVDEDIRVKVGFLTQAMVDALAPTNTFLTNPGAMRRAVETGGQSVVKGAQNFLHDLANNDGQPQQFAKGVYEVGKNMAVTPGKVVFRNDLMELIQYAPDHQDGARDPAAVQPAVDQQVLRHGSRAGPEPRAVGRRPRPHRLPDQLPQPGRVDALGRHGRLPAVRPDHRARRDPGHHRPGEGQPAGTVPRRHAHHDHARPTWTRSARTGSTAPPSSTR